jgi:DNA transposition AAA+ family ATPase
MKKIFAVTANTEMFTELVTSLENRDSGIPGLGLVFGEPGLGKTRTAIWYADKTGAVFIRALATATVRSFLEELVVELGQEPMYRASDIYHQAEKSLAENPRLVIVDEIDRLASQWQAIEALRDLTDQTGIPVLMIGMDSSERRLARFKHLYYRMQAHIMRFKPLSEADVGRFAGQICEVGLDESAISQIYRLTSGRIGNLISEFHLAEKIARANDLEIVEAKHLRRAA